MNKQELLSLIMDSFSAENIPSKSQIVNSNSGESLEIVNNFLNKKWFDVSKQELIYQNGALSYFTDEAYRYYLPAYMVLIIEDIKSADVMADHVVFHLTLPLEIDSIRLMRRVNQSGYMTEELDEFIRVEIIESTKRVNAFIKRFSSLKHTQCVVVKNFLNYINENYSNYYPDQEPIIAIERYWFQFT